jgi:hypothetical protein
LAAGVSGALSAGVSSTSAGAADGPGGLGAAFLAGAFSAAEDLDSALASSSAPYLASNFFSAGSSMLDEAVFTNSPSSPSIEIASLLEIPYFFASSETRVLATFLLLAEP